MKRTMEQEQKQYIEQSKVDDLLGVSERTITRWLRSGRIWYYNEKKKQVDYKSVEVQAQKLGITLDTSTKQELTDNLTDNNNNFDRQMSDTQNAVLQQEIEGLKRENALLNKQLDRQDVMLQRLLPPPTSTNTSQQSKKVDRHLTDKQQKRHKKNKQVQTQTKKKRKKLWGIF